jgi:hypothetical protein
VPDQIVDPRPVEAEQVPNRMQLGSFEVHCRFGFIVINSARWILSPIIGLKTIFEKAEKTMRIGNPNQIDRVGFRFFRDAGLSVTKRGNFRILACPSAPTSRSYISNAPFSCRVPSSRNLGTRLRQPAFDEDDNLEAHEEENNIVMCL